MTNKHPYKTLSTVHMRSSHRRMWLMTSQSIIQEGQRGTGAELRFVNTSVFALAWGQPSQPPEAHLSRGQPCVHCTQRLIESSAHPWSVSLDGMSRLNPHLASWMCPGHTLPYFKPARCCPAENQSKAYPVQGCQSSLPARDFQLSSEATPLKYHLLHE